MKSHKKVMNVFDKLPNQVITYRKDLKIIAGSTNAAILWQQLEYWFDKMQGKEFYKFLSPLDEERYGYKFGDSWCEELGFSESEFRTAFSQLGIRYKSKKEYDNQKNPFGDKMYCSYYNKIERKTYYLRNHDYVRFNVERICIHISTSEKIQFLEITNHSAEIERYSISITENTSETIQKITSEDSFPDKGQGGNEVSTKNKVESEKRGQNSTSVNSSDTLCTFSTESTSQLVEENELKVLKCFQENISKLCNEKTQSVMEGIPRALAIFEEFHSKEASIKLCEAIIRLSKLDWFNQYKQINPSLQAPHTIFKRSFIEKHLLTLSLNPIENGNVPNRPKSEDELREIEESNKENVRRWLEKRNKRREEQARVSEL